MRYTPWVSKPVLHVHRLMQQIHEEHDGGTGVGYPEKGDVEMFM
jgi:hypothetical protein